MGHIVLATGLVLATWAGVASAGQAVPPSEPAHKVFVITGCLEAGTASSTIFKLTDATHVGQAPTPAARGAGDSAVGPALYELQPVSSISESGVNREGMQSHVGSRVEVTVRPVEAAPDPPSANSTAPSTSAKVVEQPTQRYTVVKIARLAASCTAK